MNVYINNKFYYGLLDYDAAWYNGVFQALHKSSTWTLLADNLYKLIQGNATDGSHDIVTLNDGITGPDHWVQDRK